MKKRKVLVIFLAIAMVISYMPNTAMGATMDGGKNAVPGSGFVDMPAEGFWSTGALKAAVNNGLLNGFIEDGSTYIKPNEPLTRAQMATIVNRAFGSMETAPLSGVSDVPSSQWYFKEMQKAVKMGTMKLDGKMRPNDSITRQEAFTILGRALMLQDGTKADLAKFSDASQVSDWAVNGIAAMVKAGYIAGDNNLLNPKAEMTRAQFATVMNNVIKQYIKTPGTVKEVMSGNIMVNVAGVTIEDVTINGDLIIGDGVGDGTVTLKNVIVTGKIIVRSGKIEGNTGNTPTTGASIGGGGSSSGGGGSTTPASEFAGGLGTVTAPYLVANAEQLDNVRKHMDKHFIQTADIDLSASRWSDGQGWTPIGGSSDPFSGSYDGKGYKITGLTSKANRMYYHGFFGKTNNEAKLSNIMLVAVSIKGKEYVGGLVGINDGAIKNCYVSGSIVGEDTGSSVGGLAGRNDGNGTIDNCFVMGSVSGEKRVGGLVGLNQGDSISNSYATASVAGLNSVGGLVGERSSTAKIINSYATGLVTGVSKVGGLVGENGDEADTIINSYYDKNTTRQTGDTKGIGKTTAQMTNPATFSWGIINWAIKIAPKASYPYLKWQGETNIPYPRAEFAGGDGTVSAPYLVANAEQLNNVRGYMDKHFIQTADIDLSTSRWSDGQGWTPIGGSSDPFSGSYDGKGYKITGLTSKVNRMYYHGFFGKTNNEAKLSNIMLVAVSIKGKEYVGGLVGINDGAIKNCYVSGSIVGEDTGSSVGGLAGRNDGNGTIDNCFVMGSVSGEKRVGGLVGLNQGDSISNSYATASVAGLNSVGGLVGERSSTAKIINSYATGLVTGVSKVGGLVGENGTEPDKITNSYYDIDTTGQYDADITKGEGKTTSEMINSATFNSWNSFTWAIETTPKASYPYLVWQTANIPYPRAEFDGGTGTEADPYLVSRAEQLNNVRNYLGEGIHFKQTADIDLSAARWSDGKGWMPIGNLANNFNGSYDGNGKVIIGLKMITSSPDAYRLGLFGTTSSKAELSNINLTIVSIKGDYTIAGLVGVNGGAINKCHVRGATSESSIEGGVQYLGGLTASNEGTGTISESGTEVKVNGKLYVGGLVGYNGGNISNSYVTGEVKGTEGVGGLVGTNRAAISNSYATGKVEGTTNVGGLVGFNDITYSTIISSYYDTNTTGQTGDDKGLGKSTTEMKTPATFIGWNITTIWNIISDSYPTLK